MTYGLLASMEVIVCIGSRVDDGGRIVEPVGRKANWSL